MAGITVSVPCLDCRQHGRSTLTASELVAELAAIAAARPEVPAETWAEICGSGDA
jgi:hypothetical protein